MPQLLTRQQRAASLVEYALVMVLASVVVVGALSLTGPGVGDVFSEVVAGINAHGGGAGLEQVEETPDPCPNILVAHRYTHCDAPSRNPYFSAVMGRDVYYHVFHTVYEVYECPSYFIELETADAGTVRLNKTSERVTSGWFGAYDFQNGVATNYCAPTGSEYGGPFTATLYYNAGTDHTIDLNQAIAMP